MGSLHVALGITHARTYRIADNQTANLSQSDDDRLPLELIALQDVNFDLSLRSSSATSCSAGECRKAIALTIRGRTTPGVHHAPERTNRSARGEIPDRSSGTV